MQAAAILGLVEGRRLRRMGIQETLWHAVFTRRAGTSLMVYSLVLDSDRQLEPGMVHRALEALQRYSYDLILAGTGWGGVGNQVHQWATR